MPIKLLIWWLDRKSIVYTDCEDPSFDRICSVICMSCSRVCIKRWTKFIFWLGIGLDYFTPSTNMVNSNVVRYWALCPVCFQIMFNHQYFTPPTDTLINGQHLSLIGPCWEGELFLFTNTLFPLLFYPDTLTLTLGKICRSYCSQVYIL